MPQGIRTPHSGAPGTTTQSAYEYNLRETWAQAHPHCMWVSPRLSPNLYASKSPSLTENSSPSLSPERPRLNCSSHQPFVRLGLGVQKTQKRKQGNRDSLKRWQQNMRVKVKGSSKHQNWSFLFGIIQNMGCQNTRTSHGNWVSDWY